MSLCPRVLFCLVVRLSSGTVMTMLLRDVYDGIYKRPPLSRRSVLSLLCSGAVDHGADLGLTFFSGPALIPPFGY
jgi:hypothetical protein